MIGARPTGPIVDGSPPPEPPDELERELPILDAIPWTDDADAWRATVLDGACRVDDEDDDDPDAWREAIGEPEHVDVTRDPAWLARVAALGRLPGGMPADVGPRSMADFPPAPPGACDPLPEPPDLPDDDLARLGHRLPVTGRPVTFPPREPADDPDPPTPPEPAKDVDMPEPDPHPDDDPDAWRSTIGDPEPARDVDAAGAAKGAEPMDDARDVAGDRPEPEPEREPEREPEPERELVAGDWHSLLARTARDQVLRTAANVAVYLGHDPAWRDAIELDERVGTVRLVRRPPFPGDLASARDTYPREVCDADLVRIQAYLSRVHEYTPGLDAIHQGLDAIAARRPRDPVREYLDALVWDGTPRIDTWTSRYLGAPDSLYTRGIGGRWLVSAVARTYRPGCQADHVLVLEGAQGTGKSTALRTIAGPDEWFSDEVSSLGSKDAADSLRGPWIIELAELDAANRSDVATLKAFLTRRVDRFRAAYGRRTLNHPRRCVFAASTNEHAYAKDATGSRRLWPVRTRAIDLPALRRDRDQLWAEARDRYRAGDPWHPDGELAAACAEEQAARYLEDAWQGDVEAYLSGRDEVTVREIATDAIGIELARVGQADSNRIVRCLAVAGWKRSTSLVWRTIHGVRQKVRVYAPAEIADDA